MNNKKGDDLNFTGERYVPEVHGNIELEHVHRYLQAREIAAGKVVLDIASGEGYGTALLSASAKSAIGVDISEEAINHARSRYKKENLQYLVGSCAEIPLPDKSVDLVVSFETIEHHDQHDEMMKEIKRVLRPDGALVISSPDKNNYSIEPSYHNEYHVKELFQQEFKALLEANFKKVNYFGQRVIYGSAIFSEAISTTIHTYRQEEQVLKEAAGLGKPIYWIAVASDGEIPELSSGALEQPIEDSQVTRFWTDQVKDREASIREQQSFVSHRDAQILALHHKVGERDIRIEGFVQDALRHQVELERRQQTIVEASLQIQNLRQETSASADQIHGLTQVVLERDTLIAGLRERVGESEIEIAAMREDAISKGALLEDLQKALSDRSHQLQVERTIVAEQGSSIRDLQKTLESLSHRIQETEGVAQVLRGEIRALVESNSWRLTAPLRAVRRIVLSKPNSNIRKFASDGARALWHRIPLTTKAKQELKGFAFRRMPMVFRWSRAFRDWVAFHAVSDDRIHCESEIHTDAQNALSTSLLYVPLVEQRPPKNLPVKLIAFYLPQFHAIPENDEWWGEGFTEWTNVRRASPKFEGHYQPRVPEDLGYYDLLDPSIQRRQVELARLFGIGGFCFYHYWFGGKRLLEQPVENYLKDRSLNLPFCLCWANENWSRRWDGLDSELLISQRHSPDDDLAFVECISRYFRDERYIRIGGKPILLVYRPALLPSPKETSNRWRNWCRENGIGEIYLAYTQSFDVFDPAQIGFDAAIEFPPNNSSPPNITDSAKPLGAEINCTIYDWQVFVDRSQRYKNPAYKLFRCVCPSWDNTARRRKGGTVFLNSTPAKFKEWLSNAIKNAVQQFRNVDERLVFINAWNEWAEGAYLEPDKSYGYAYLQATREALIENSATETPRQLIIVVHDALAHGAQYLALGIVRALTREFRFNVCTVLLGPGRLTDEFRDASTLCEEFAFSESSENARKQFASRLYADGYRHAIVNSVASAGFGSTLSQVGVRCTTLIHELPGIIRAYKLEKNAVALAKTSDCVVFPTRSAAKAFGEFALVPSDRLLIRPQGLWRRNYWRFRLDEARETVRRRINASPSALVVLGVGYIDYRKGPDLFVQMGLEVLKERPDAHFIWIGHADESFERVVEKLLREGNRREAFHFIGFEPSTSMYHAAADVFALTSREDPFPNVVVESYDAGVPVVAFEGSGGGAELAASVGGMVVPFEDTRAFSRAILEIGNASELRRSLGKEAIREVDRDYALRAYLFDLLDSLGIERKRVSVVVPNYNYARFMVERLQSITTQTIPIFELIILDDASTDGSLQVISSWLENSNVEAQVVSNECNSGSVVQQWAKGVSLARGEFVWIAEADDLCSPDMLEVLLEPFEDPKVVLSYCESQQIDESGKVVAQNYREYVKDISADRWTSEYVRPGTEEITSALAIKNTIPNVSGVLFRRDALAVVLSEKLADITEFRQAADWLIYIEILTKGNIAYSPLNRNLHRRHRSSVIAGDRKEALVREIERVQRVVQERFALTEGIVAQARSYSRELYRQFGLESA